MAKITSRMAKNRQFWQMCLMARLKFTVFDTFAPFGHPLGYPLETTFGHPDGLTWPNTPLIQAIKPGHWPETPYSWFPGKDPCRTPGRVTPGRLASSGDCGYFPVAYMFTVSGTFNLTQS